MKKIFVCLMLLLLLLPLALRLAEPGVSGTIAAAPGEPGFLDQALGQPPALIRAWGRLNSILGDSGSPQVVLGREGFLFFRPALGSVLGQGLMSDPEVEALAQALHLLHQALQAQGTAFALLVAPDKGQVAPQHLPPHIRPVNQENSNLSRLLNRLKALGVPAPDLVPLLQQQEQAYLQKDSHWSAWGAYVALQEGLSALCIPGLKEYSPDDFSKEVPAPGDLVPLYLPGLADTQTDRVPEMARAYRASRPIRSLDDLKINTTGPQGSPRLLVARDSFGRALFPFLASLAGTLEYSRDYAGLAERAREQDGVLVVIAQRDLPVLLDRLGLDEKPAGAE